MQLVANKMDAYEEQQDLPLQSPVLSQRPEAIPGAGEEAASAAWHPRLPAFEKQVSLVLQLTGLTGPAVSRAYAIRAVQAGGGDFDAIAPWVESNPE